MTKNIVRYPELNALKGRIREEKSSYRKLAKDTSIGVASLTNKLNGKSTFDTAEIERVSCKLNIAAEDVVKYFFPRMLRNAL